MWDRCRERHIRSALAQRRTLLGRRQVEGMMFADLMSCGITGWIGMTLVAGAGFLLLLVALLAVAALAKFLFTRTAGRTQAVTR